MPWLRLLLLSILCCLARGADTKNCEAGFTGTSCESPICAENGVLWRHDGQADNGETIDSELSPMCNDTFAFGVDEYMSTVYITITGSLDADFINGTLISPHDIPVIPTRTEQFQIYQIRYTYEKLVDITGYGNYKFALSSSDERSCIYVVQSPTLLIANGGFIMDPRSDNVQTISPDDHKGVSTNPQLGVSAWFAFGLPQTILYPARPTKIGIYANGLAEVDFDVVPRYHCSAAAIAGPFTCSNMATYYHLKVMGIDSLGNNWQRVYDFNCEPTGGVPTPSSPPPPDSCYNGGIMVDGGTPNRRCWCPKYFEGNQCEVKQCMNRGRLGTDERCICRIGYTGLYCQQVQCSSLSQAQFDISSRALVFVVRATYSMNVNRLEIRRAAERIGGFHGTHSAGYFQKYVLVAIANGELVFKEEFDVLKDFLTAIETYPARQDVGCSDSLFTGLSIALDSGAVAQFPYSPIFVFSDGVTDDGDDALITLLHQLSFWRGQVFFMLTNAADGRCVIDVADMGYRTLRYLAQFSHGLVSFVESSELNEMTFNLAFALTRGSFLMSNDMIHSCSRAPALQTFFVDDQIEYFFIIATGQNLTVQLVDPFKITIYPPVFHQSGNTYIWSLEAVNYGSYMMTIKSAGPNAPCQYRVIGRTESNLFVGISDSLTNDATIKQPLWNKESHIVARISNVDLSFNPTDIHAEALIWTNEGETDKRIALYASNGIYRDQCDYNLYFGSWKCQTPFQFYGINIFVTDVNGYTMMRTATGFCSGDIPTPAPPGGCLNGGYPLVNGTCLCIGPYTGLLCETARCFNGGSPLGAVCNCPAGYTGIHCEAALCWDKSPKTWTPHGRSLTLMIHDSVTTRTTLRSISENIARVLENALSHHQEWISAYQVIRFNDTTYDIAGNLTTTDQAIQAVNNIYNRNRQLSEVSCKDLDVIPMLLDALDRPEITDQGIVFLFINGYINDSAQNVLQLYETMENSKLQLNVILLSTSPCGTSLEDQQTKTLQNLASFSSGRFFMSMPSKAGEVLRIIPTLYRSSFIYENYVEDCSVPQSFYFPIDSQTQAFTAFIMGEMETDPVYQYQNPDIHNVSQYPYGVKDPVNVLKDYGSGTRLDQIIRGCDDGWQAFDNHCWFFGVRRVTWIQARHDCHQQDAVLATVYNGAEQQFMDIQSMNENFWTGLNNRANYDVWEWDQLGKNKLTLATTGFANWELGQPVDDGDSRCVFDNKKDGKKWTNTDCGQKYGYLCMKHAYDSEFEPEMDGKTNDLPRGIWKLSMQTVEGPCNVEIYSQSGIELFSEFTNNVHLDIGFPEPLAYSPDNYMIAHTTNQQWAGQGLQGRLEYSHFYLNNNMSLIHAENFVKRDLETCGNEWVSDGFTCPGNTFMTVSTGVDRFGYMYQRIQPVMCFKGPNGYEDCKNDAAYDGTLHKCYCTPNYQGTYCDMPICRHGYLNPSKLGCVCYDGYSGGFCQNLLCTTPGTAVQPTPNDRTFILAIDGTHTNPEMHAILTDIEMILNRVIDKAAQNAGWFTHFTGIVFRDSASPMSISQVFEADQKGDFIQKIKFEVSKPSTSAEKSRPVISAIGYVMESQFIQPRSELFIITAGDVSDYSRIPIAFMGIARKRVFANVMIVGDKAPPGDKTYTDIGVTTYFDLTSASGGNFYQLPGIAADFATFWEGLIGTMYDTYYVTEYEILNCSNIVEYIQVGTKSTNFIVDAVTQTKPTISIFDPAGNPMTNFDTNLDTVTNHLIKVAVTTPGLWKVVVDQDQPNPGFCGIAVRGQSPLEINIGFIQNVGADKGDHSSNAALYPTAGGVDNAIVVARNYGTPLFAQIFSKDGRKLLWSSPLIQRLHCPYPYKSANLFKCTEPTLVVAIDAVDDSGIAIRRMIQVHCL